MHPQNFFSFAATLMLVLTIDTNSSAQEIVWENTIGGSSHDVLNFISGTADNGSVCIAGSFSNVSGDKTEDRVGGLDYWIIKLDSSGNVEWDKTIGGGDWDNPKYVGQTVDGGYICAGISLSDSSIHKSENCIGLEDFWIIKLNALGNIEWENTIGGTDIDELMAIQQTSDGGYICGGMSLSSVSGDKSDPPRGGGDYWIIKLSPMGLIEWQRTIGGNGNDFLTSISQNRDGTYICGGYSNSNSSGDKLENCFGQVDYWVLKLDSVGNIIWQNTIGGTEYDELKVVLQTTDGGFICAGSSASGISFDKTSDGWGHFDYWIVKLDTTGNIEWEKSYGGTEMDELYSISLTPSGGYILGGETRSGISGTRTTTNLGIDDYWLVCIDPHGSILWQTSLGGIFVDVLHSVYSDVDGDIICAGMSDSPAENMKSEFLGGLDGWVVKLTSRFNSIKGSIYFDADYDGALDPGEQLLKHKKVRETGSNRFVFSDEHGNYSLGVLSTGNQTVLAESIQYFNAQPLSHTVNFTGMLQVDSLNDFAFQSAGPVNDLRVTISPIGFFRPGFDAQYHITYENAGTNTIHNATLHFYPDVSLSYVASTITPSGISADSISWQLGALDPFQSGNISVIVNVSPATSIGATLISDVGINPITGDLTPFDNYSDWEVIVSGSYDPNDIIVDQDTLISDLFPNPPYLQYMVRFQNTGTDTAFNVKILNPIDTSVLDLNSFEFVASSHPVNLQYLYHERNMEFKFDWIMLPDSHINQSASNGFILYRIKPRSTLAEDDSITNKAAIYFDFNAPVHTNTAITRVLKPTGINDLNDNEHRLTIFPNPSSEKITVRYPNLIRPPQSVRIFDFLGKTVYAATGLSQNSTMELDISGLPSGLYFVELLFDKSSMTGKFQRD